MYSLSHTSPYWIYLADSRKATSDGEKVHDTVVKAMRAALCTFNADLEDYLMAIKKGPLPGGAMVEDTIGIFEALAKLLTVLLNCGNKKLKGLSHRVVIDY